MIPEPFEKVTIAILGLIFLAQPLLIWGLSRGLKTLREVRDQLATQNGRIAKMEVKIDRAEYDIERHQSRLDGCQES